MTAPAAISPDEFRRALGSFPTGVCVITTRCPDGLPIGVTCSSFNSVSLDPPLVLWSLAKKAYSRPMFESAEHWAVHVLAEGQEDVSNTFAKAGEDKFSNFELEPGIGSVPLLEQCTTRFQCKTENIYDGGDHIILLGRVLEFAHNDCAPLIFHSGRYTYRRDGASRGERAG